MHLSGEPQLRNGLITEVCEKAPEHVKQEFSLLERRVRLERQQQSVSRKRASELMHNSPLLKRKKQQSLSYQKEIVDNDVVDDAWALALFGLDIAPNKIDHDLFREAIATTLKAKPGSVSFCYFYWCFICVYIVLLMAIFIVNQCDVCFIVYY